MNMKYSKLIVIIMVLVILFAMSSVALADPPDPTKDTGKDVTDQLKSGTGLMGDGAMKTIQGLSKDIFNIVRYVVIAYLVIKTFGFFAQFSNAGDDPRLKASLKSRLLWTVGGLVLSLNFWNIYNFIATISVK